MNISGKTILLVAPEDMGLNALIAKNLSFCGFEVISYEHPQFKYKNLYERLVNFFRKFILNDFSYKSKMRDLEGQNMLLEISQQNKHINYTLIIRPDLCSDNFLSIIKGISSKTIGYQWDGLDRFPDVFAKLHFFDNFFVFDPMDIHQYSQYNLCLITNFYFDYVKKAQDLVQDNNSPIIAYFIGSHLDQRTPIVLQMLNCFCKVGIEPLFMIAGLHDHNKQTAYQGYPVTFLANYISFEENLTNVQSADIIVDILNDIHGGLSFRAFEALYYDKKLITNNVNIAQYDFFDEHNILIWNIETSVEELRAFLNKPYRNPDNQIIYKYSFTNWIRYMLGIDPYIALDSHLK
ncbi:hypothetical protein [Moraxella cuniculi]|uniref:4-alpha-L-fucosyltransferase n=1 Tax=Moraxella cuniculi TaxID=34061 RepID=A0A3S4RL68_9GAMM|nr:hypothetical protein [Moraxella cuniculi]VEG13281.1 Uncharacterised protein [Moraxella cuniculi]